MGSNACLVHENLEGSGYILFGDAPPVSFDDKGECFLLWSFRGQDVPSLAFVGYGLQLQFSTMLLGSYLSHTIPSSSPSHAFGTISAGNPPPSPWFPCTRYSPASAASSHDSYAVPSGFAVGLCSPVTVPR